MYERKHIVQIARARRRVKALVESSAPWLSQERARRQFRKVESKSSRIAKR